MAQKLRWEAGHHGVPAASSAMVSEALQAFLIRRIEAQES